MRGGELSDQFSQRGLGRLHQGAVHRKPGDSAAGKFILKVTENTLAYRRKPTRTGLFVGCLPCDLPKCVLIECNFDPIGGKCSLILPNDRSLAVLEDIEQVARAQRLAHDANGKSSDEFR